MNTLTFPTSRQAAVWLAPQGAAPAMLDLAARAAAAGRAILVLDGGNHFNAGRVARLIRQHGEHDVVRALNAIRVRRAFTCYQILAMLEDAPRPSVAAGAPVLVLDLLATFYDENVRLPEAKRLLLRAAGQIERLAQSGPVVASARPPAPAVRERAALIELLERRLPVFYAAEPAALPARASQPGLPLDGGSI